MTPSILIVSLVFVGISMLVFMVLKSKFKAYNKIPMENGISGKEVAEKMLRHNGIYDVKVTSADDLLSEHYNPIHKPVEFGASRRGLAWLSRSNITSQQEYPKAKNALKWAATTYVVAALASLATLVLYILIYSNRQRG